MIRILARRLARHLFQSPKLPLPPSSRSYSSTPPSSTPSLSLQSHPYRIAIVGAGPASFYTASRLLSLPGSENIKVDLFELVPVPFGLARFGVAPDHPSVKNCIHKFIETAQDRRLTYYGNVQISGSISTEQESSSPCSTTSSIVPNLYPSPHAYQLPISTLLPNYDTLVLTYGASLDRSLGNIPGETTLLAIDSARNFVNWYNGHPLSTLNASPSTSLDLSTTGHVTIIGQGNVALDLTRILLKPIDELKPFDVPEPVLAELARSNVRKVEVVGRRGVLQFAGTTKEVRELIGLNQLGVGFRIEEELVNEGLGVLEKEKGIVDARIRKRALGLLKKGYEENVKDGKKDKEWELKFLKSPVEFLSSSTTNASASPLSTPTVSTILDPQRVCAVKYAHNRIPSPPSSTPLDPSTWSVESTSDSSFVPTDAVFKSIGYRSIPIPGIPFDHKKGIIPNSNGRVELPQALGKQEANASVYVGGWLARGPTGVIATTMFDAFQLADQIAMDLMQDRSVASPPAHPKQGLSLSSVEEGKRIVSWKDWERIDEVERERGGKLGKSREKICTVQEMLDVLD
ncbi:BQ2448_987 [Microbotryum intermedium]|uniref:NADPH:adrenodoxin oxidoreductase, mitochondrial n=1 Tax=Microbotryum intermedium TaxID=269621 RepID=A0A238FCQ2_9BASI|nr:BQ2448_987 [Microbotryum intermedium]